MIVATNIAGTSLSIDGVRIVVDSGLERRNRFDPATGMNRLETVRISRASADHRRVRAGRTAPGVCYRLWSESAQATLLPQAPPEILEADLAPLALELACWGCSDPTSLAWLDPPPPASLAQARDLLAQLEAVDAGRRVTQLGRDMASLGIHPRLAHMVLRARSLGLGPLACQVAALLSERDPLRAAPGFRDPDLFHRIEVLNGRAAPAHFDVDAGAIRRIQRVAQQVERQLGRTVGNRVVPAPDSTPAVASASAPEDATGLLLAFAYPDRIGRARDGSPGRYVLSGGRGAEFRDPNLPPVAEDYFEPWMSGTLHNADAVALVVDLSDPGCVEQLEAIERRLVEKKVSLVPRLDAPAAVGPGEDEAGFDPFRARLPALLLANKADLFAHPEAELAVFREIAPDPFDSLAVSAETGAGLAAIGPALFSLLGIARVYSKVHGHPPDMGRPFTLRGGGTVRDVAQQVHRGMAAELKFARIWGQSAEFEGQQVSAAHPVADRDVVELHW